MQFRIESCTFSNSEEFGCTFKFYTLGKKHIISKTHKCSLHFLDPVCTKSKVLEREENILFTLPKSGRLATIKRLVCRLRFSIEANSRSHGVSLRARWLCSSSQMATLTPATLSSFIDRLI